MTLRKPVLITPTVLAAVILATSIVVAPVMAAQPHFVGTPACTTSGSGTTTKSLTCSGKITGLGNISTVRAALVADITTQCDGERSVTGGSTPLSVQNGNTVFTLTISASANCSPPQVGSVTFTNVRVVVSNFVLPISGTFDP